MGNGDDFSRSFLERVLDQHRADERGFLRELKVVSVVLVLFQFLVFFRFVHLDDEWRRLDTQVQRLETDQHALVEVNVGISDLNASLQPLLSELRQVPDVLRVDLQALDTARSRLEPPADSGAPEANATQGDCVVPDTCAPVPMEPALGQTPIQSPVGQQDSPRFDAIVELVQTLPENEREVLRMGTPQDRFDAIARRLVDENLLPPIFADLNQQREDVFTGDFARANQRLATILDERAPELARQATPIARQAKDLGLTPVDVTGLQNAREAFVQRLQVPIQPPESEGWWKTYDSKTGEMKVAEEALVGFGDQVWSAAAALHGFTDRLSTVIIATTEARVAVEERLTVLRAEFGEVRDTFAGYANPLPVVPIDLEYAVILFPVVLAATLAYFAWRYLTLREVVKDLTKTARRYGLAEDVSRLYLPEPSSAAGSSVFGKRIREAIAAFVAVPALLTIISLSRILRSEGLLEGRALPLVLAYLVAVAVMAAVYGRLVQLAFADQER